MVLFTEAMGPSGGPSLLEEVKQKGQALKVYSLPLFPAVSLPATYVNGNVITHLYVPVRCHAFSTILSINLVEA